MLLLRPHVLVALGQGSTLVHLHNVRVNADPRRRGQAGGGSREGLAAGALADVQPGGLAPNAHRVMVPTPVTRRERNAERLTCERRTAASECGAEVDVCDGPLERDDNSRFGEASIMRRQRRVVLRPALVADGLTRRLGARDLDALSGARQAVALNTMAWHVNTYANKEKDAHTHAFSDNPCSDRGNVACIAYASGFIAYLPRSRKCARRSLARRRTQLFNATCKRTPPASLHPLSRCTSQGCAMSNAPARRHPNMQPAIVWRARAAQENTESRSPTMRK